MFVFKIAQEIGRFISSRRRGSELRQQLLGVLAAGESHVVLDFAGVASVSGSFSDEVLGVLVKARGEAWVRDHVKLANLDSWTAAAIEQVIRERVGVATEQRISQTPAHA